MSTPPRNLSPDERLALVDDLERREAGRMRQAVRGAQLSLAIIAIVLAALLVGIYSASRKLVSLNLDIERKQSALATLIGAVRTDPGALSGVSTALDKDPRAVTLVPRVYIQILDDADRQWAKNLSDRFQNGGVIPVGIEYVRTPSSLSRFEVRYYKQDEEEEGARGLAARGGGPGVAAPPVSQTRENKRRWRETRLGGGAPPTARAPRLRRVGPET